MLHKHGSPVDFDIKSVTEDGTIRGYVSVFGVKDRGNDIVVPGAFKASLLRYPANRVKMLYQHNPTEPIGVWTQFVEDAKGLMAEGRLILETAKGREVHALLKAGAIDGFSIGYRTLRDTIDRTKGARLLQEVELREVSIVTFPMNEDATVSSVKQTSSSNHRALVDAINGARRAIS